MNGGCTISVIVPTYNSCASIAPCIEALLAAGFSPCDIVVVDDASSVPVLPLVTDHGVKLIEIAQNRGAGNARNVGAAASDAEVLFFVDADVCVHPDTREVLEHLLASYPDHAAVFGTYDDAPAHKSPISRIRNLLHRHVHVRNAGEATTFWSGCGAIRRKDFDAVDGFCKVRRTIEDIDIGMKLAQHGRKIRLCPTLQGKHLKRWTLRNMTYTDLFLRAIPWARLMRSGPGKDAPEALNVSGVSKVSAMAVATSLLGVLMLAVLPAPGLLTVMCALVVLAVANKSFLDVLDGPADRTAALGVLWVHYLCGGFGFFWVRSGLDAVFCGAKNR
ncbi:MAG: GT2 family glycosyltransferase [Paracoccaceae bacterium]|jgi:GT2 family glycosyltransferase